MEANNQDQDQDLDVVKVSPQLSEENTQENSIKKEESPMNMVSFYKEDRGLKISPFLCRHRSQGSFFNEALIGIFIALYG